MPYGRRGGFGAGDGVYAHVQWGGGEGGMEEEEEGVSESTRLLLEKEKYKTRVGERGRAGRRDRKNGGGGREKM